MHKHFQYGTALICKPSGCDPIFQSPPQSMSRKTVNLSKTSAETRHQPEGKWFNAPNVVRRVDWTA
jgi:hypothetical protein